MQITRFDWYFGIFLMIVSMATWMTIYFKIKNNSYEEKDFEDSGKKVKIYGTSKHIIAYQGTVLYSIDQIYYVRCVVNDKLKTIKFHESELKFEA